ncbi:hypothetical protein CBL_07235 [Carabus blaptoides fortunei]
MTIDMSGKEVRPRLRCHNKSITRRSAVEDGSPADVQLAYIIKYTRTETATDTSRKQPYVAAAWKHGTASQINRELKQDFSGQNAHSDDMVVKALTCAVKIIIPRAFDLFGYRAARTHTTSRTRPMPGWAISKTNPPVAEGDGEHTCEVVMKQR